MLFTLSIVWNAQGQRPVESVYSLEIGGASILDTYLSPIKYSGINLAFRGKWLKPLNDNPLKLTMQFDGALSSMLTQNPVGNADMYNMSVNFRWSLWHGWQPATRLTLSVGVGPELNAGVNYLPRGGNNPATAIADVDISLGFKGSYDFKIGKLPIRLNDEVSLPSLSVFFQQDYGEPYYEIYIGNRKGLVHCGWWGNHFCIDNLLSADLKFKRGALRLGYRFEVRSSWQSHINRQLISNSFVIGWQPK